MQTLTIFKDMVPLVIWLGFMQNMFTTNAGEGVELSLPFPMQRPRNKDIRVSTPIFVCWDLMHHGSHTNYKLQGR